MPAYNCHVGSNSNGNDNRRQLWEQRQFMKKPKRTLTRIPFDCFGLLVDFDVGGD